MFLRSAVGVGRKVFEEIVEAQAALEAALGFRIDLWVYDDDGLSEGRGVFDFLRGGAGFGGREGFVFDDGVESLEIGEGHGAPESFPDGGLDAGCDEIYEALFVALLSPETHDEDKGLGDFALAEGVAEVDGRAVFRGLGIYGHAAETLVRRGGDVPFLRVAGGLVAVEKRIAHPLFQDEAVLLDFLGGGDGERRDEDGGAEESRESP